MLIFKERFSYKYKLQRLLTMKRLSIFFGLLMLVMASFARGYQVGDVVSDFRLPNLHGQRVSMADYPNAKGFVIIFSCNRCGIAVGFEDRKIALHEKFAPKGFPVIAINPDNPQTHPHLVDRARERGFPFHYLFDDRQVVLRRFGVTFRPHVFILERNRRDLRVAYMGALDNNYRDATLVTERYVENAINALLAGSRPDPEFTQPVGSAIRGR